MTAKADEPSGLGRPRHNLPAQRSSFIGRQREIQVVRADLDRRRIVTLTGVGGSGKTRLALEVATRELERFPDGVFFVDLSSLTDGSLIPRTVAAALDLPLVGLQADAARTTVLEFLKDRVTLLALDNCEHLIPECAELVDEVLESSPEVTVLATSREALNVEGEQVFGVPPLRLPEAGADPGQSEAVDLFVTRARDVRSDFELGSSNEVKVAELCRRLDGIPLALELAAARIAHLSLDDILSRLDDRFRLLTRGPRRKPERQQTLQAAIDWSYGLLGEDERALLRRLSVFSGGFTLRAAEGICTEGLGAPALDLLASLVSKSLVVTEAREGTTRYRLLETIRFYAADRLAESGEAETYRRCHRDWFLGWAESHPLDDLAYRYDLVEDLAGEIDNFRAALDGSETVGDLDATVRIAVALAGVWYHAGHHEEGHRRLRKLTARPELDPSLRARCLTVAAYVALNNGDFALMGERSQEALELDPEGLLSPLALLLRGIFLAGSPEGSDEGRRLLEESFRGAELRGQTHQARFAKATEAQLDVVARRYRQAVELVEQMLPEDPVPSFDDMYLRWGLAGALLLSGDPAGAREQGRLMEACGSHHHYFVYGRVLSAEGAAELGERDEARRDLVAATRAQLDRPFPLMDQECLVGFAVLSATERDFERTRRLLKTVVNSRVTLWPFRSQVGVAVYRHYRDRARRALDPETMKRAEAAGRSMTVEEALRQELERSEAILEGRTLEDGPDESPDDAAGLVEIRLTGDGWTIRYEGSSFVLSDSKGLHYLARLLAEPGRELHVLDLVAAVEGTPPDGSRVRVGDTGEVLDDRARSEYRSRLEDLKSELDEATANADTGRAERLRQEIEFVSGELTAAYGLGGRARRGGDVAERARKAVSNRIRAAIGQIDKHAPNLAEHLTRSVRTGRFCAYEPTDSVHWST